MANVATAEGRIGAVNPDSRTTSPEFALNTQQIGVDGFVYRYVQADGVIAASQTDVTVSAAGQASDGAGTYVNTLAFADNEYGWVRNVVILANAT